MDNQSIEYRVRRLRADARLALLLSFTLAVLMGSVCTEPYIAVPALAAPLPAGKPSALSKMRAAFKKPHGDNDTAKKETDNKSGRTGEEFVGGVINGKGHLYRLQGPVGWRMDTQSGVVRGIPVVFTPADAPGPDYPTVLYSQIMQTNGRSLDELIKGMVQMMKPGSAMDDDFEQAPIALDGERQAVVRKLPPGADGNRELVAFIVEKDWLVLIILAADTDPDILRARPDFERLVQSYKFGSDKVKSKN